MQVLLIILYVLAAVFCVFGLKLYFDLRKLNKFGQPVMARVMNVESTGKGMFTKYTADASYKIDKKKYKAKVQTSFYQPIMKNSEIQLRYNILKQTDAIVAPNDAFRLFIIVGLSFLIIANLLSYL